MARRPLCWSLSTNRVKFVVAYDGTDFCGWAAQAGRRTVQSTLKEAVRQVSGEDCEITGASRTDSGAHARGQVCHFDSVADIDPEVWPRAINRVLPAEVRVVSARRVPESFHSRFCARDRWYRYTILIGEPDPFRGRYAHELHRELDLAAMKIGARALVGRHDFRAYTEELDKSTENTFRDMRSVEVSQVRDEVRIDIVGTAFLRGMMRRMSGALMEVGRGKRKVETVGELLTERGMSLHRPVVLPAKGLTLMAVRYGRHPVDNRES